ncbi:MAG TPA: hypothetical protein VFA84_04805 [Acidimicrobiales bacterium]|nr:hypothetical protein [Acidimicrobiales bacterium]
MTASGMLSVGGRMMAGVRSDTLGFSAAVRAVAEEARRMGLVVPGFCSPPRLAGADRTIRRSRGEPIVAVRLRGRPFSDVVADVVEGVLVANGIRGRPQWQVRRRLLAAVERVLAPAA